MQVIEGFELTINMLDTTIVYLACWRKCFLVTSIERTCVTYSTHNSIILKCTHSYIWMRGQQLTSISIFKWITVLYINRELNRGKKKTTPFETENFKFFDKTCQQVASLTMLSLQKVQCHHFKKKKKKKPTTKNSRQEQLRLLTIQGCDTTPVTHI